MKSLNRLVILAERVQVPAFALAVAERRRRTTLRCLIQRSSLLLTAISAVPSGEVPIYGPFATQLSTQIGNEIRKIALSMVSTRLAWKGMSQCLWEKRNGQKLSVGPARQTPADGTRPRSFWWNCVSAASRRPNKKARPRTKRNRQLRSPRSIVIGDGALMQCRIRLLLH